MADSLYPTTVLKVKIDCCNKCPTKLNEALFKINGVYSVFVDKEQNLVSVTGNIDPMVLIKYIAKMGKTAELFSYQKEPSHDNGRSHTKNKQTDEEVDCFQTRSSKIGGEKNKIQDCFCNDFDHKDKDYQQQPPPCLPEKASGGRTNHYGPPRPKRSDDHICSDPYCKIHRKDGFGHEQMYYQQQHHHPYNDHPGFSEELPPYSHEQMYYQRHRPYNGHPGFYNKELPPYNHHLLPPQSGYHQQQQQQQPRPMTGIDKFTYFFNDENSKSCTIM